MIRIIPVTGGNSRWLAGAGDPNVYLSNLAWSPDGKTIYFGKQTNERLLSIIDSFR